MDFFNNKTEFVLLKRKVFNEIELAVKNDRLLSNFYINELQNKLSDYTKSKYCILTKSGTQALEVILKSNNIGIGDYVITTQYTFIATYSAIMNIGAIPVLVDINKSDFNIDPVKIEEKILEYKNKNKDISAILTVDIFGAPCDYDNIIKIANKYNIKLFEDACQGLTGEYHDDKICNVGCIASAVSFYPTKPFGGYGEGGAIFTNDENTFNKCKSILNHGSNGFNNCVIIGTNGSSDSLHSIFLLEKFKNIDNDFLKRDKISKIYLNNLNGVKFQEINKDCKSSFCRFQILFDNNEIKNNVTSKMKKNNMPYDELYCNTILDNDISYSLEKNKKIDSISNNIAKRSLSLPIYPNINEIELMEFINKFNIIVGELI